MKPKDLGHKFESEKNVPTNRCKKCGLSYLMVDLAIRAFKNPNELEQKFTCIDISKMFGVKIK